MQLQLNKSALAREAALLRTYERFLPSLDLKRRQLMAERAKAETVVSGMEVDVQALIADVGPSVPMLGNATINLDGLATLTDYRLGEENVVGTRLPVLESVEVAVKPYSPLARPHWVDDVACLLHDVLEARLRLQVGRQRLAILTAAVATITQRVNLFEKILIPNARANVKKIRIYLNDEEMAAVVRSKISKKKRALA